MEDDNRAFEAMMAELEDSDSDESDDKSRYISKAAAKKGKNVYSNNKKNAPYKQYGNSATYKDERKSKVADDIENFGDTKHSTKVQNAVSSSAPQAIETKRWLMKPCTPGDVEIQCYVDRERNFTGMSSCYRLYLEGSESGSDVIQPRFLLTAKKKTTARTSYYLISMDLDCNDRGSDMVLGKLRGNSSNTSYFMYDHGVSVDKAKTPSMLRKVKCDN